MLLARVGISVAWLGVVLTVACGEMARQKEEMGDAWSPEAAELIFVSDRDGDSEIYLLRPGSPDWINLTNDPSVDNWPEWSPDGSRIAFQSRRAGNLDIWVMDADGSNPVQLTDHPEEDYLPAWSPDGESISFVSWRQEQGNDEARANHVYIMNADGSDQRRLLAESPGVSAGVTWSPDGSRLLQTRKVGDTGSDVFLLDLEGAVVTRLTDDRSSSGTPVFSPDGSRIAYYADDGGTSRIVITDDRGADHRDLIADGQNWYPRWSPDGSWLVYTVGSDDDDGDYDVMATPVDGGAVPVTLVGGPGREAEARWRPR